MATAEITRDLFPANTQTVIPLIGDAVQGSAQEYRVMVSSVQSPAPVFFAPYESLRESMTHWEVLVRSTLRALYTHVVSTNRNYSAWDRAILDLMRISTLPTDWDGEGAQAISASAVRTAYVLLSLAQTAAHSCRLLQCPVPGVFPSVDGAIVLKWVVGNKELKCTATDEVVEVVRWNSVEAYESDGLWEVPVHQTSEHFEWLLQ
jgi:hypothetical protein